MKQAILCVDDEAIIVISLIQELKNSFGDAFVYEKALNPEQAFQAIENLKAESVHVSLIISDWLMPGMKGDEFLDQIRQKYPEIKAIVLTGHADEAAVKRMKVNSCVCAVLPKPWNPAILRTLVSNVCRRNGTSGEYQ